MTVVASYCTTFLKPEMQHIYRQVTGLRRHSTFVVTRERMEAARYPFADIELLPEPRQNLVRRFVLKFIRRVPPLNYRGELAQLTALFERREADLMHVYFGHTGVHLREFLRVWRRPAVVSFHGADVMMREDRPKYAGQMRDLFRLVPLVLARSASLARRIEEAGCPAEKIRLNRTGIPLGEFPVAPRRAPQNGEWQFVQACRLIAKKGLHTTLRAFAVFHARHPAARLVIAGDGPMRAELVAAAGEAGVGDAVTFTGFLSQDDLRLLYGNAHVFLHPSEVTNRQDQEGVPNSMLEAMATGLPVAATRHGGIPEAVTDGLAGLLVGEGDPEALAGAMEDLVSDPARWAEFGRAAASAVREKFDQEAAISALEGFYEEAIALGKPTSPGHA